MEFTEFVRKPFVVEAVEVTEENIADVAEFVGTLRTKDDGTPYIQVDRRLIPNIYRVYPGFWMTRMGDNIRCYSKRIFEEQFIENDAVTSDFVFAINNRLSDKFYDHLSDENCDCDACTARKAKSSYSLTVEAPEDDDAA